MGTRGRWVGIAVLGVALIASSTAHAQVSISYLGETPVTGANSYGGANASVLWDYVYTISKSNPIQGPFTFFVVTPHAPTSIFDEDGAWVGQWVANAALPGNPLNGQPGVLWNWATSGTPALGTFHFSSAMPPGLNPWMADGAVPGFDGSGTTYSPITPEYVVPEPASMALTLLAVGLAGGVARRRKGKGTDPAA